MSAQKVSLQQTLEKVSLPVLLMAITFVICVTGLYAVAHMLFTINNVLFDEHVFALIRPYITNTKTAVFNLITFFGSVTFLLPANLLLILYLGIVKKQRLQALKVAAVSITCTMMLSTIKNAVKRQRPPSPLVVNVHNYSFPSGHTFTSVVFFGMLCYLVLLHIKNVSLKYTVVFMLVLLVFAIGCSRVYLRLHYATDVIAGFCLGILWLLLAKWILFKTRR